MGPHLLSASKAIIDSIAWGVEFAAALLIGLAALEATVKALFLFVRRSSQPEQKNEVRLTLARWLAVALEFELAADILHTAVTPTWSAIEKLAAIAALRTGLNYFLEKEIGQAADPDQRAADRTVKNSAVHPLRGSNGND